MIKLDLVTLQEHMQQYIEDLLESGELNSTIYDIAKCGNNNSLRSFLIEEMEDSFCMNCERIYDYCEECDNKCGEDCEENKDKLKDIGYTLVSYTLSDSEKLNRVFDIMGIRDWALSAYPQYIVNNELKATV